MKNEIKAGDLVKYRIVDDGEDGTGEVLDEGEDTVSQIEKNGNIIFVNCGLIAKASECIKITKEKFHTAAITSTGGFKRRIVELFVKHPIESECDVADILYRLQFIMDEYKESILRQCL